jgi:hypothetical protein
VILSNRRKKIPLDAKMLPLLEVEYNPLYDLIISVNGDHLIDLDINQEFRKNPLCLYMERSSSEYEVVLDLSSLVNLNADRISVDIECKRNVNTDAHEVLNLPSVAMAMMGKLEVSYKCGYYNSNGKYITGFEVLERKITMRKGKLDQIIFENVRQIVKERDRKFRK